MVKIVSPINQAKKALVEELWINKGLNKRQTCRQLQISRPTLDGWIKRFKIRKPKRP